MDKEGILSQAQAAVDTVNWVPEWGRARIDAMLDGRPDWCVSRQRTWGVPITLLVNKVDGALHPRTIELIEDVAQRIEKKGIDAWFDLEVADLLGEEADAYEKVVDTLDVWFDSGVTHACVPASARACRRRQTFTWRAPTSTVGGSSLHYSQV